MIDFWLAMAALLLLACGFIAWPLMRYRRGSDTRPDHAREAANVEAYATRLAELTAQHQAGMLTAAQLHDAQTEAARELLTDTAKRPEARPTRAKMALPLCAAIVVPLLALGLYLHLGASDKVELDRELAQPPGTLAQMTERLERTTRAQPDSAQSWYFLGRSYMAASRFEAARQAFTKAIDLAGRQPELLGQLAQATYFASDKHWSPALQSVIDEALKANPDEATSLGLLGISAFEQQRYAAAIDYWQHLLRVLPANDTSRVTLQGGIDRARQMLKSAPSSAGVAPAEGPQTNASKSSANALVLRVDVSLDPAVAKQVLPSDSVFVFAKATTGPPLPLAAKRLTVADLPATVELRDSDAMVAGLKLSNFPEVQIVARVSRAGTPTTGEWSGRSQPLVSQTSSLATVITKVLIDSPGP